MIRKQNRSTKFAETILFTLLYLATGYLIDHKDILIVNTDLTFMTLFLSIVTLYFGMASGMLSISIFAVAEYLIYESLNYDIFLKDLIFVLMLGSFHWYWHDRTQRQKKKIIAIEDRLQRMSTSYYALKVSHDQLEMNYVLRPTSLRKTVKRIVAIFDRDEELYENFMFLLKKTFGISKMSICSNEKGVVKCVASFGFKNNFDEDDLLIKEALARKSTVYVSQLDDNNRSRYIAVIPALNEDNEVRSLILIEEMPFMSFNEDNMISISFFFEYFYLTLDSRRLIQKYDMFKEFEDEFRFEYLRLYELNQRYGIESAVIALRSYSELSMHILSETIAKQKRGLDVFGMARCGERYVVLVLTAFSISSSAEILRNRIYENLSDEVQKDIESSVFLISKQTLLLEFSGCDSHDTDK